MRRRGSNSFGGSGAAGEEKGPGRDSRFEIVLFPRSAFRVLERSLRERKQRMLPTLDLLGDQLVQPPEGALGIPAKALGQVPAVQDVLTEEAGRARVQRTAGQLVGDRARGHPADAHRWSTRHQEEGGAGDEARAHQAGAVPWPGRPLAALPEAFAPRNP